MAKTGALTVVTGSTANLVFALRNGGSNIYLVRKIQIGYITTTGYTAAQYQDFGAYIARSYTGASSGGTAITISGNTNKLRTSLGTLSTPDCRISTTGALTAGTLTVDTNPIGVYGNWCAAAAAGAGFPLTTIFDQGPGDYPLVLANQEGLVICPITTMGAAGGLGVVTFVDTNGGYTGSISATLANSCDWVSGTLFIYNDKATSTGNFFLLF